MQRDVKVGLVLGVLLVAVVAVVFFRRDDEDRDKFSKLLPAPDAVADRARDMLGPSQSDPYPVAPEYLGESWKSQSKAARTPTPPRNKNGELTAQIDSVANGPSARQDSSVAAVLQQPEFEPPRNSNRPKAEMLSARARSWHGSGRTGTGTEYTIQDGDTLSEIARHQLGSASRYMEIYEENKDTLKDPASITVGQKIRIPTKQDRSIADRVSAGGLVASSTAVPQRGARGNSQPDASKTAASEPAGSYVVKDGDTLTRIARKHYNSDSMYLEILRANSHQIENPGDIRPGMVLRLP